MSTRCNIVVKDSKGFREHLIFYRHCDGYPEGVLPLLTKFMTWVKEGKLRNNPEQSAGWLIVLGHQEYEILPEPSKDWQVGSIEPATQIHSDIEYLYVCDLSLLTIDICTPKFSSKDYSFIGQTIQKTIKI